MTRNILLYGAGGVVLRRARGLLGVFVVFQIPDQTSDAYLDPFEMVRGQDASFGVDEGEPQTFQRHVVVVGTKRPLP
jgi:hypothetical protein